MKPNSQQPEPALPDLEGKPGTPRLLCQPVFGTCSPVARPNRRASDTPDQLSFDAETLAGQLSFDDVKE